VAQVARVEFDQRQITLPQVEAVLRQASAVAESAPQPPPTVHADVRSTSADSRSWYARHRELAWSVTSGALLLAGWLVERSPSGRPSVAIGLFVLSYVFGARDNVGHFLRDLQRGKVHFNIDLLMVVAAVGAAALGEWAEGALLLFLFSLGHALEHHALGRARHAITALADLAPSRATLLREVDGSRREELVLIEAVRPGDIVVVKGVPGSIKRRSPARVCRSTRCRAIRCSPEPSTAKAHW
jgi:Cd2+/Zn2+-exporting ATPase